MALQDIHQRSGYLFIGVMLAHVLLISAQVNSKSGVPVLESVTFGIFSEVQRGLSGGVSGIRGVWDGYVGLRHARAENEELKRQLGTTQIELQEQRHCVGGCPIGSIAAEIADDDPHARADLAAGFERWEAPIRAGLARMRDRGDLRPDTDTDTLALALLAALQGGLLLTQTRRDPAPLRAGLDTVLALIRTHATPATSGRKR